MTRSSEPQVFDLTRRFVGLAEDRSRLLEVDRDFWSKLESGALGALDRLVSCWHVNEDWKHWEYCEDGQDFACLMSGAVEFLLEDDEGRENNVILTEPGSTLLLPPRTWFRARMRSPAMLLFVTSGRGNRQRPA